MDPLIAILVFIGVIAVTALLFSGWAVYGIFRAIFSGISSLIVPESRPRRAVMSPDAGRTRCPRARCHANNPPDARFCRRCGASLLENLAGVSTAASGAQPRQVFARPAPARAAKRVAS